jgi:formylglycine-generating enzyme required for sulfatase activity
VRGGSWDYRPFDARSAFRNKDRPDEEFGNFGFRPVVSSE